MLMTTIMSNGLRTLQTTPKTLRRYLSLKSLLTSCLRIKMSLASALDAWLFPSLAFVDTIEPLTNSKCSQIRKTW